MPNRGTHLVTRGWGMWIAVMKSGGRCGGGKHLSGKTSLYSIIFIRKREREEELAAGERAKQKKEQEKSWEVCTIHSLFSLFFFFIFFFFLSFFPPHLSRSLSPCS